MTFLPEEELKERGGLNLAPMIDFLFLMLAFFASLAMSRVATKDLDIDLVKIKEEKSQQTLAQATTDKKNISITIDADGVYTWKTDLNDYEMFSPEEITKELETQFETGYLPPQRDKTTVFLKIDRQAPWDPIARLIYEVRGSGFMIKPIYQVDESSEEDALVKNMNGG